MIAITGASGKVGRRVADTLAGEELRFVVRDASRAPAGGEVAVATYGDGRAMCEAFHGVETVLLVSAAESRERVREHATAVDAAVAAGVRRIVYTSFMGAARDAVFRDDVADVAAAVVASGAAHAGNTYDVTGPESLDVDAAAAVLSDAVGRRFAYEEETLEQARESRRPSGHPDWEIEGWVTSYAAIAAGVLERVSDTVERVCGRPPRSLADVLREHPESYAHLVS